MRRLLAITCVLLMLVSSACAEIVGMTTDDTAPYIYIHRYDADGQDIYFVSMEEEVYAQNTDVSFDGVEDLLLITHMGAQNIGYLIYLKTEDGYVLANPDGLVWNYRLDEERKLLISSAINGFAGALREDTVYRWEDGALVKLRTAFAEQKEEIEFLEDGYRLTSYDEQLVRRVVDYTEDAGEGTVLWQDEVTLEDMDDPARFNELEDALMSGL